MESKKEKKIEKCNKCNKRFNVLEHNNSGYFGKDFIPICHICREEYSI